MKFIMYAFVSLLMICGNRMFAQSKSIKVSVNNLRNGKGVCRVYLFSSYKGSPFKSFRAECKIVKVDNDTVSVVFDNVTPDVYALSVFYDENEDGKMDTDFWGDQKEGWAVSRTIRPGVSFPKFDEAKISFDTNGLTVSINKVYVR